MNVGKRKLRSMWKMFHRLCQREMSLLPQIENDANLFLLFLVGTSSLLLVRPSELLAPILPLFPLLSRGLLNLRRNTNTHLSIMWLHIKTRYSAKGRYLKLLEVCFTVVNQSKSSRLSSTKLSTKAKCLDGLLGSLVEGC